MHLDDIDYVFDVKEFAPGTAGELHEYFAWYGPKQFIEPIRQKINEAARQFKQFKDKPCCLVLYNHGSRYIHLEKWWDVAGAMYGERAWTFDFDQSTGRAIEGTNRSAFTEGGKMIRQQTSEPQNTTFSAVLILRYVDLGAARPHALPRSSRGRLECESMPFDVPERRLGIVVHENKDARIPFPQHIFNGPFDEGYGPVGDAITRIY